MRGTAIVLGAGIVGMSVALHLQQRGMAVVVVDRGDPRLGASFGNAGIVQREVVFPTAFPRDMGTISRILLNRSVDVHYHPLGIASSALKLIAYWRNSAPDRYQRIVGHAGALIRTCLDEHRILAEQAGCEELLLPTGWIRAFGSGGELDGAIRQAKVAHDMFGVNFEVLDDAALQRAEPSLTIRRPGAIFWSDPYTLRDPALLVQRYVEQFVRKGGSVVKADARSLSRHGSGWKVATPEGLIEASDVVVALGSGSTEVTSRFGYNPPLFGKRGYHAHYQPLEGAGLNRPFLDTTSGFMLAPMAKGIRLCTGVQFARPDGSLNPVQLERAEPIAREILPLGQRIENTPWSGVRPCMPDMLPVIGPLARVATMWCAFGHGHQGLTLGPTTGRLIADLMCGDTPFVDPTPYAPDRF